LCAKCNFFTVDHFNRIIQSPGFSGHIRKGLVLLRTPNPTEISKSIQYDWFDENNTYLEASNLMHYKISNNFDLFNSHLGVSRKILQEDWKVLKI